VFTSYIPCGRKTFAARDVIIPEFIPYRNKVRSVYNIKDHPYYTWSILKRPTPSREGVSSRKFSLMNLLKCMRDYLFFF
jgi:hypothetical protein